MAVGRAASMAALTAKVPILSMKSEVFIVFILVLLSAGRFLPALCGRGVKIARLDQSGERYVPRS